MPFICGMLMSTSATSTGRVGSSINPSCPFAASPTTTFGSSWVRSPRTSFMRSRAGCSSSTRKMRKGAVALIDVRPLRRRPRAGHRARRRPPVRDHDRDLVVLALHPALELRLDVEVEREPLADVGERDPVPLAMLVLRVVRVGELEVHLVAAAADRDLDRPRRGAGLDAVIDGVLDERLQQERRYERVARRVLGLPPHDEPRAEPELLELEVLAREVELLRERGEVLHVGH